MAGIIREARDIYKYLAKVKKDHEKFLTCLRDQGVDTTNATTVEEIMEGRLDEKLNEFEEICKIAVKLRNIAVDTGLIADKSGDGVEDNPKLNGKYAMITIRPIEGAYTLEEFHIYLLTYLKKSYFLGGKYAFEQVGEDILSIGKGWHVHIVCKLKDYVQFQELERDIAKCIPGYVKPGSEGNTKYIFQVGEKNDGSKKRVRKFLERQRDLEYCLNYIDGDKHDADKEQAVSLNTQWRMAMDIEDVYTWGENVDFRRAALPESSTKVGECIVEEVH